MGYGDGTPRDINLSSTASFAKSLHAGDKKGYENVVRTHGVRDDSNMNRMIHDPNVGAAAGGPNLGKDARELALRIAADKKKKK